jgi:Ca-activated chloride channel family protein
MADDDLDRALHRLRRTPVPAASDDAKARAIAAAMQAFDAEGAEKNPVARTQGPTSRRRLISGAGQSAWRRIMQNRIAIGGIAAGVIAFPLVAALVVERGAFVPAPSPVLDATPPQQQAGTSVPAETRGRGIVDAGKTEAAPSLGEEAADLAVSQDGYADLPIAPGPDGEADIAMAPEPTPETGGLAAPPPPAPLGGAAPARLERKLAAPMSTTAAFDAASQQAPARDRFEPADPNGVKVTAEAPVSTFSIDADTASYAWVRRSLAQGTLPAPDAVRVEELINYFPYAYPLPLTREEPFRPMVAVYPTPWNADTRIVHIGIKGYDVVPAERPVANLVFLVDVSGSMDAPDKLPLVKASLKMLSGQLSDRDHIAIVTYAGEAGVALPPTPGSDLATITAAIDKLGAGGSTAGAAGIETAYALARANFVNDGVNRVVLATDGDFNVGTSDDAGLTRLIEEERKSGVFLSVLGFGEGNYNDALMQRLAQNGNGTAAYIDQLDEAQKVLVDEATSTLFPVAKDVKIQVEFNPAAVAEYRLIGYETRLLSRTDFNDDTVDAGEVGSGATVTALYEIVPVGSPARLSDDLRYAARPGPAAPSDGEYGFLKIRYKLPNEDTSRLFEQPIDRSLETDALASLSDDVRFAAAVAAFGQKLKGTRFTEAMPWDAVIALAEGARGADPWGYRNGFVRLARLAKSLSGH